jgi:transposase
MRAKAKTKGGARLGYHRGEGRNQADALPAALDDDRGAEPPVRGLEAVVEPLDLEPFGFVRATAAATGRPGAAPGVLVRLSRHGDRKRLRSSRRLEQAAARPLDLRWRLGQRRPAFQTSAAFRRAHGAAMKQVGREVTRLGQALDRFGGELIAIDGSTLQAVNGQKRTCRGRKLVQWRTASDAKIEAYLQQRDRQDVEEPPLRTPPAEQMPQKLEPWQARQPRDQHDQPPRPQSGANQRSLTDPDSRQITPGASSLVGEPVPVAVDAPYTLRVEHDVTQAVTDQPPLGPRAARAQPP